MVKSNRQSGHQSMSEDAIAELADKTSEEVKQEVLDYLHIMQSAVATQPPALPEHERALMEAHGVDFTLNKPDAIAMRSKAAALYSVIVASAFDADRVCSHLNVSKSRLRQRVIEGSLFAIAEGGHRVYPTFQFTPAGVIRGLPDVLDALGKNRHPLAVYRFFCTPTFDLEIPGDDEAVSPREYLESGGAIADVVLLAKDA